MKKLLLFTGLLIVLIIVLGEFFRTLALRFDPNEPKVVDIINMNNEKYDILFMGNSVTQQGINPEVIDRELQANTYNLATGGGSIFENELILRNYLLHNEKPKLIVYGLYVNEVTWGGSLRPTFRYSFDKKVRQHYKQKLKKRDLNKHLNIIPLFRYRVSLEHALKFIVNPGDRNYSHYKGFLVTTVTKKVPTKLPKHTSGINENSYRDFMDYAKKEGIKVLLLELPNSPSFNKATLKRDSTLQAILNYPDAKFISLNNKLDLYPPEMWTGLNHFNIKGANAFSEILADTLRHYY